MSFTAKLKLEDEEMNVLHHCSPAPRKTQTLPANPLPYREGGAVDLVVEGTGSTDLFDWMISPTQTKNGTVTFYRRDTMSKLKTLEFTDAHCVQYRETFDHTGDNPLTIVLTISARELKLNDSDFKNNWPGN